MSKKLTIQQLLFVHEYLVDLNATRAALRAGYSEKTADVIASQLMTKPQVKEAIQRQMDQRAAKIDLTAEKVLNEIMKMAFVDIGEAFDDQGNLLPMKVMSENVRRAVSSVKVYKEYAGKGGAPIGETSEVKFWDKPKSLEMLGRHLKLFTDKMELSGTENLAQRLAKARRSKGE